MSHKKRLVVFLIPPQKLVNGGILSIFSIAEVSRRFENIHHAEVVLATYPGEPTYKHNDLFKNNETIYSFDEVVSWGTPEFLQLHVPEYASYNIVSSIKEQAKYHKYVQAVADLRVNIMNQNILLMQPPHEVAEWFAVTPQVTQTTAHNKYSTQELANEYFLPTKHLSTFVDATQYQWVPFEEKENIIALSPDLMEHREKVVEKLKKELPDYKVITIQNLSYEDYKHFIARAKFTLTFGEGFDGYYVESFFTGGLCLAVYNDEFFPDKKFSTFGNTFGSYQDLLSSVVRTIKKFEDAQTYQKTNKQNLAEINKLYSFDAYVNNVKDFYLGKFNYQPQAGSAQRLLAAVLDYRDQLLTEKDGVISGRDKTIKDMAVMIEDKQKDVDHLNSAISDIKQSYSWKVTKPLRGVSSVLKR